MKRNNFILKKTKLNKSTNRKIFLNVNNLTFANQNE